VNEARNLLADYVPADVEQKDASEMPNRDEEQDEDVADTLMRARQDAGGGDEAVAGRRRRPHLQQYPTGVRNCLFFSPSSTTTMESIYASALALVTSAQQSPLCRSLQRVTPIETTCPVDMNALQTTLATLVSKHFLASSQDSSMSFAIDYKARNNSQLERKDVLEMGAKTVCDLAPWTRVDLDKPQKTIVVQVMCTAILLSIVDDYIAYRRYALHPPSDDQVPKNGDGDMEKSAVE